MNYSVTKYPKSLKSKTSRFYYSVYIFNTRYLINSGVSIEMKYWDEKKKAIKNSYGLKYIKEKELLEKENNVKRYLEGLISHNTEFRYDEVKKKLNEIIDGEVIIQASFNDELEKFIEDRFRSHQYKNSTAKNYITLKKLSLTFAKKYGQIDFLKIDHLFMEKFYKFLINENPSIHNNYAKKQLSNLKTFLNNCFKSGIIKNTLFREFRPKNTKKSTKVDIRLDSEELLKIENYIPESTTLEKTKDLFLIQCYTGLRVSDLMKLNSQSIDKDKTIIKISTQKTDEVAQIPIIPKLFSILEKYNFSDYPRYKDPVYNRNIKMLCKNSGLFSTVSTKEYKGSKVQTNTYEKWQLITSNIARKTFITHLVELDFSIDEIKVLTGHRKNQTVENYIKFTKNEILDKVKNKMLQF